MCESCSAGVLQVADMLHQYRAGRPEWAGAIDQAYQAGDADTLAVLALSGAWLSAQLAEAMQGVYWSLAPARGTDAAAIRVVQLLDRLAQLAGMAQHAQSGG
jgi:hypothetical protein